jgi:hypothetical protein
MKGCARTCLLWLVIWAAAAAALFVYLREFGVLEPQLYWACGVGGLLFTMAAGYAFNAETARRERAVLLDAVTGVPLEDGKWVAVSGAIRSLHPLHAPFSNTPCVAYAYKVYERKRTSKGSTIATTLEGKAITPSTIATRHGGVRLLAVPQFDLPADSVPREVAVERAKAYVQATQFAKKGDVKAESTDDDGSFRIDTSFDASNVNYDECTFEEHVVKQGEVVCAFGLYSQQRGGLIPHPNWSHQARIMRGDAESVAAKLRARIVRNVVGVVITGALTYGIVMLYRYATA